MSCFMQALTLTPASSAYLTLGGTVNQYANVMNFWLAMLPRMGGQGMTLGDSSGTVVRGGWQVSQSASCGASAYVLSMLAL
jgi:hypothetical protein